MSNNEKNDAIIALTTSNIIPYIMYFTVVYYYLILTITV